MVTLKQKKRFAMNDLNVSIEELIKIIENWDVSIF